MGKLETLLRFALGLFFIVLGGMKLAGMDRMVDNFARLRYPQWLRVVTGAFEVCGAGGLLVGRGRPGLAAGASALLAATMVGALISHARIHDPARTLQRPGIVLALLLVHAGGLVRRKRRFEQSG